MKVFFTKISLLITVLLLTACASTLDKYKEKADAGDVESQYILGNEYYLGSKAIPKNKDLAIKYLTLASDAGSIDASFVLGLLYYKDKQYEKAIGYYGHAVEANDLRAQDNLAIIYHYGKGVKKDFKKAEELYLKAAANGSEFSERNLAVLYKGEKQYEKSIEMFKRVVIKPTSKSISTKLKKLITLEVMDMYLLLKDDQQAYVWGATAILSGALDSKINGAAKYLADFDTISNEIGVNTQGLLAKGVLKNHYEIFQKYESYFLKHKEIKPVNHVISLAVKDSVGLVGYHMSMNRKTIQGINYLKTKTGRNEIITLGLYKLKLASSYVTYGAIFPRLYLAQTQINEAMEILNKYDDGKLILIKKNAESKLSIINNIYDYQKEQVEKLK